VRPSFEPGQGQVFDGFIPHLLIEGMITSSFALGANLSYLHSWRYMWVYKILERAIAEGESSRVLGKNILGSGFDLELYVHIGGAYICGEKLL
jgi:NADH-quinone oxidoreductase subunit F